ncbi:MAG: hypothetical protein MJZ21_05725 [archaeon]|nr:hypothetical protein [archaeon]
MEKLLGKNIWEVFDVEDSRKVIIECTKASRALAELKGVARNIPLSDLTRNYISTIEAAYISELEGTPVDVDTVFKAAVAVEGEYPKDITEVLSIADAIRDHSSNVPTQDLIVRINSQICKTSSVFRSGKNGPKKTDDNGNSIPYPDARNAPRLFNQLLAYVDSDTGTDELIKCIVALAIFEAVSPFEKHNRATGAILFHMMLNHYGLTDGCGILLFPTLVKHREDFFRKLQFAEVSGHTEAWIMFMLGMIREAAIDTMHYLFTISLLAEQIPEDTSGLSFFTPEIMRIVYGNIYCKSSMLIESKIAERVTAMKYLKLLECRGILQSEKVGREVVFRNLALYNVLLNKA